MIKKSLIIILCIILSTIILGYSFSNSKIVRIKISDRIYTFELAQTQEAREKGLMFRKALDQDSGMFFIFEKEDYLIFYMKDTLIPLDIAFIDSKLRIVDIQQMEPLDTTFIVSKAKALYALEVNRGFFEEAGIKLGDKIEPITALKGIEDISSSN